jgi:microcystin-dependent protein
MITLGEVRQFAYTPDSAIWALCDGTRLMVDQNKALFSLLGTTHGGDGVSTFGLPNFNEQVQNFGLPLYYIAIVGELVTEQKLLTPLYRKKLLGDARS